MVYNWIPIAALCALAVLGNYFSFEIFHGIDFVFGSIAGFVALRLFGIGRGCFVAFLGAMVTYFDWGQPFGVIVFTLEIAVVGMLWRRIENLVLADAAYWLVLGVGSVVLFYTGFLGLSADSAVFIALKQAVNGLLNAVLAAFLLEIGRVYVPALRRLLPPVSIRTLLSYLVSIVIMGASTLFVLVQTHAGYSRAVNGMNTAMNLVANWADYELEENGGDEALVRTAFEKRVSNVLSRLDNRNFPLSDVSIGIVHSDGRVSVIIGELRSLSGDGQIFEGRHGVDQWEPDGDMPQLRSAREGVYVVRTPSQFTPSQGEIVVEVSAAPLIDVLEDAGRRTLLLLGLVFVGVLILSRLLTHGLTRPTQQFARMSEGLVDSIMRGGPPPRMSNSGILELDAIGGVVRKMSLQLARSFRAQKALNETLEERVKLRTSELDLLSQVAKQTTNSVIVTDVQGRVTWINDACTRLTGFSLEDMLGKKPGEVLQKVRSFDEINENMRLGIQNTQGFHVELVNYKKDGTPYCVEIRCNPIFDKAGTHTGFIAIENDVTNRHETSMALQESLGRLHLATKMTNLGIWTYESCSQSVEWNEENAMLHGIPRSAPNRYTLWEEAVHPDDLRTMASLLCNLRSDGQDDVEFEYRFLHPELGERLISSRVQLISDDQTGVRRYTGANLDITDISKTNERLEQAAAKTAAILDNALESILTVDSRGLITSFNTAAQKLFGYRAEDVLGKTVGILMPGMHSSRHSRYIASSLKRRKARMIDKVTELEAIRANGKVFPVELAVSKSIDETGIVYIGIVRDLTDRHKIDRMKSEFLAMVSHELRTPLTSIQGTLSLLNAGIFGQLDTKGQKMVGSSLDNAQTLGVMIDEILDLEKLSAGKLEVYVEQVELGDMLRRTADSIQPYADKFSVKLEFEEAVPGTALLADPNRAVQVLTNFISNAVKFSPAREVVRVHTSRNSSFMRVSVTDKGRGIPKDKHDMLFQKFSQIDSSDARQNRGTGLGLAISRELMESMGGRIGFASEDGAGATFWAEFRISAEAKEQQQHEISSFTDTAVPDE